MSKLEKIGRNDPCPCNSGLKYKNCHSKNKFNIYETEPRELINRFSKYDLSNRNLELIEAVYEVFGLSKGKTLDYIKRNISTQQIIELYKITSSIWPQNIDVNKFLPEPSNKLSAFYMGDIYPEMIIDNITRFSLYADKIFIINPFLNPWLYKSEFNPLYNPIEFKADTLKLIVFVIMLEPWIRSGIVELLPSVGDFNRNLFFDTVEQATKRTKSMPLQEEDFEDYRPYMMNENFRFFYNLPESYHINQLKQFKPGITDVEVQQYLKEIQRQREEDPLSLNQPIPNDSTEKTGQFNLNRMGSNLETALYICQVTGSFPYTNLKYRWKELLSVKNKLDEKSKIWTPLTNAFQKLEFQFLNKIDAKFACRIREDGRLESFRSFIRRIWNNIDGTFDDSKLERQSLELSDELTSEYSKAEAEWIKIKSDLMKWTIPAMSSAIITGGLSLDIPTLGFSSAVVGKLIENYYNKKSFRKSVPMSIFIDLNKKS